MTRGGLRSASKFWGFLTFQTCFTIVSLWQKSTKVGATGHESIIVADIRKCNRNSCQAMAVHPLQFFATTTFKPAEPWILAENGGCHVGHVSAFKLSAQQAATGWGHPIDAEQKMVRPLSSQLFPI